MLPHETALVKRLENEPFVLFGVNTDEDPAYYRKECLANKVTWPNIFQGSTSGEISMQWGVSGYPTIYIVDAQGEIRFRDLRGEELENAVLQLIAEAKGERERPDDDSHEGHSAEEHPGGSDGTREPIPMVPLRGGGMQPAKPADDDGGSTEGEPKRESTPATPLRPGGSH